MTYDVDYFIEKFRKIPDRQWHTGAFVSPNRTRRCALGHCAGAPTISDDGGDGGDGGSIELSWKRSNRITEREALRQLFHKHLSVEAAAVNDGNYARESDVVVPGNSSATFDFAVRCPTYQLGFNAKTRILTALLLIKAGVEV